MTFKHNALPPAPWPAALLDALPSAVVVVARDGAVVFMNAAAEALFEVGSAQACAKKIADDAALSALVARVMEAGQALREAEHVLGKRRVRLHLVPLWEEKAVASVMLVCEPLGLAEQMNQQQLQREAAKRAGLMAAMLAHEVKNPLSGIRGAAQLLGAEARAENKDLAGLICREVDRLSVLLSDIEVFSDTRPLALAGVNLHEVLRDVRRMAEGSFAQHVRFVERFDPSLPEALASRDALVQVVLNVVKNAAEATAGQADACITLRTLYRTGAQPLVVEIEDNGPGIPEALRDVLFAPFQTSKEQGKGLGLAIVAKLMADMGGSVEIDSEPGKTCVRLGLVVG